MKPLVFLGSGISKPSGLPDVAGLTAALLEPIWYKHTDSNFYRRREHAACPETQQCQVFLRRLMERVRPYYERHRQTEPNYEDLFSLVEQLMHEDLNWDENAAIEPFTAEMKIQVRDLCVPPTPVYGEYSFVRLASTTLNFIQCVVWHRLRFDAEPVGLKLLSEIAAFPTAKPLTICTLNHDLLVERFFKSVGTPVVDGFGPEEGGVRFFEKSEFRKTSEGPVLLKLHGSINWWRLRPNDGDPHDDRIGILTKSIHDCRSKSGRRFTDLESRPSFLTGSYNKIVSYGGGISLALMDELNQALEQHQCLVMSGYGWSDRGINMRLKNWLWGSRERRIILLHQDPESLHASKGLWASFDDFVKSEKLVLIRKWFCNASMDDLRAVLGPVVGQ